MSERTLRRIVIAFATITVLWLGATLLRRGGGTASHDGPLEQALEQLRVDTANAFTITSPAGVRTELLHGADGWTVNGMPADSAGVDRLQRILREVSAGDVVATTASNHDRLGVHADSAWVLDVRAGEHSTSLLIGRSGTRAGTGYVRLPDSDETWQVDQDLRSAVSPTINEWRDKVMARIDTARVARVVLSRQGQSFALVRDSAGWTVDGDPMLRADSLASRNVLTELARFEAAAFAPDTAAFDGDDQRTVVALTTAGDTLVNLEFAGREYIWRARRAGETTLFDVASFRIDRLVPMRADVLAQAPRSD
jgi:hypothetical protein